MVTTEELRVSLLSAGTKRTNDFNKLNATIAALKDVDESIEMANAKKKLQEQELKKSTDELITSLFQTVILLTTKMDELENKVKTLENSKGCCTCKDKDDTYPYEELEQPEHISIIEDDTESSIGMNNPYYKDQADDISKKEHDELEDYAKEAAESM